MIKTDIPSSITKCLIEQTVIIYVEIFKTFVIFLSVISIYFFLRHADVLPTSLYEIKRKISKSTINICTCNLDIFFFDPNEWYFFFDPNEWYFFFDPNEWYFFFDPNEWYFQYQQTDDECNIKTLNTNKNNNISYEGLDISLVQSDSLEN